MCTQNGLIIAIDGPSGSGKSTTAKLLAQRLNYSYIDTGAMYRAVTFFALEEKIPSANIENLQNLVKNLDFKFIKNGEELIVNGKNVSKEIRSPIVSENVSQYSKIPEVRKILVEKQREFGKIGKIVMEGRDITTTVFPNADLKIFLTAELDIRAYRRMIELIEKGIQSNIEEVRNNLETRDTIDSSRDVSPLVQTEDSIIINTTRLTIDEQVNAIYNKAIEILNKNVN